MKLKLAGAVLVAGAIVTFIAAYWGKPDVSTCQVINSVATQLGNPATCSSSPVAWLTWLALAFGVTGLAAMVLGRRPA